MRIRIAKKIGRTITQRHRQGTIMKAASTYIMRDVRNFGWPGNMDAVLWITYGLPQFGGLLNKKQEKALQRSKGL